MSDIRMSMLATEQQKDIWKEAEEAIDPKIREMEMWGELEVLKRYLEDYGKLSSLMKSYVALLSEDRERIYGAVQAFMEVEAKLLI